MKNIDSQSHIKTFVALIFLSFLGGCASVFDSESEDVDVLDGGPVAESAPLSENADLVMKVKTEFIKSPELNAAPILVEAAEGVVELDGFVDTEAKRELATQVAQGVTGVKQVINGIEVK